LSSSRTRVCASNWSSRLLPTPERRMTPTALRGCAAMTGRGRRSRQASTSHPHRHSGRRGARVAGFHVCPPSPPPALAPAPADPRHGPATSPSSRLHVVALGRGNAILASILPAVRVVPHRRGLFSTILGRRRDCRVVPEGGRLLRSPERLSPRSGGLLLPGRPVSRGPGGSAHAGSSVGVPSSGRQPHRRPRLSRSAKRREFDVGVLFSSDTDLVPALEAVIALRPGSPPACEVAAWAAPGMRPRTLSVRGVRLRRHLLAAADYRAVADETDYTRPS
jgi:hypothetical protein